MNPRDTAAPRFAVPIGRRLRRRGFVGAAATVALAGGAVEISGERAGSVAIPLAEIERLRAGFAQGRGVLFHQILLWRRGERRPLLLGTADRSEHPGFGDFVRATASALADFGRLGAIETGEGRVWATVMVSLIGLVAVGFAGAFVFALSQSDAALGVPRALAAVFTGVPFCGALALAWWAWSRHWPRRIRALAELDRVLPPR